MGMGYQGFAAFYLTGGQPPADKRILLCTGAGVNQVLEPIYSNSVVGQGWFNAGEKSHYADGPLRYEGSIDTELQGSPDVWNFLRKFAIDMRAYPRSFDISPDGQRVYRYWTSGTYESVLDNYGLFCDTFSINASLSANITASIGVKGLYREEADPAGGHAYDDYTYIKQKIGVNGTKVLMDSLRPLNPSGTNIDPIPYWKAQASVLRLATPASYAPFSGGTLPQDRLETMDWSVDISNNLQLVYAASGSRLPVACMCGAIGVSGNVTLFNQDGVFDPILGPTGTEGTRDNPYLYAENTVFRARITTTPGNYIYIELPAPVFESDDYGIKGQSDVTTRAFSISGLSGRTYGAVSLPPALMSDSDGAWVSPV